MEDKSTLFYNIEAEQCLLGCALAEPEGRKQLLNLPAGAIYYAEHQAITDAIIELDAQKKTADIVTVSNRLIEKGQLDAIGGAAYLTKLSGGIFWLKTLAKQYAEVILECHNRRLQAQLARDYSAKIMAGEDPEETREWMLRSITEIKQQKDNHLVSARDALVTTYQKIEADYQRENDGAARILSGISTLDNKMGGLSGAKYVAIGARPSVGKSIFALTYCVNAAKQGKRVLLVSLEMDEVDITERVLANFGSVNMNKIVNPKTLEENDWLNLAKGLGPASNLSLWYSTEADTVEKVRRAAYELYENGGIDLIAIDYIQLMDATNSKKQNREQQISEISRGLRRLSQELKIPILVLTQLNRASAKGQMVKGVKMRTEPTMSEARESGSIEQDANIFMLLHDPQESEMRNEEEKEVFRSLKDQGYQMMRIIIDKNRQGKRGRVTLAFDGDHMRFLPIARNVEAPY